MDSNDNAALGLILLIASFVVGCVAGGLAVATIAFLLHIGG